METVEFEPLTDDDARHLLNELMSTGRIAGIYVSRAAMQLGDHHPLTEAYDKVCQRLTFASIEFQRALKELENPDNLPDPDGSNALAIPPAHTDAYLMGDGYSGA